MKIGVLATFSLAFALAIPLAIAAGLSGDQDGDGVPDVSDNCILVFNPAPADCNTDGDAFGNACDGDFDQSGTVNPTDFSMFFIPDFMTQMDSGVGTDHDCSGTVNPTDFGMFFIPQFMQGFPGP